MLAPIDLPFAGSRRWRIAAWLGVAASIGVAVIVLLTTARASGAATLLGCAGVSALLLLGKERVPPFLTFLFSLVGLLNGAGYAWVLFTQPGPFDEIAHLFTTFVSALTLAYAVHRSVRVQFCEHLTLFILMITSFGVSVSVVWEWIEWLFNFGSGLDDTLSDLLFGAIGALLAGFLAAWGLRQEPVAKDFTLIRPGSVIHGFDMDQRFIRLNATGKPDVPGTTPARGPPPTASSNSLRATQ